MELSAGELDILSREISGGALMLLFVGRLLSDPATADYDITVVEDRGLAGRDGPLGFVEDDLNFIVTDAVD